MRKYELISHEEGSFPVTMMARLLQIHRSGYYAWKHERASGHVLRERAARRAYLRELIQQIWEDHKRTYGSRRIHEQLKRQGETASLGLVRKLMRELRLSGIQPRASKRTTIPAADADHRRDFLGRRFNPSVPTTYLVGDITYLKTSEGWLYLATVIDLCTRQVVGWQTADHMRAGLIVDALAMAWRAGYVAGGAIFHSDRGAQYTSAEFAEAAERMDVRLSVGRTGVCWDNAVAESFFAALKKELWYRQTAPGTRARARLLVADYIEVFYNRQRLHSTLGYQTPASVMESFFDRYPLLSEGDQTAIAA